MTAVELILRNGKVTTLNRKKPEASAVAVADRRFVAVGDDSEVMTLQNPDTQVIDLCGRRLIPGLNDSHLHLIRGGLNYNLELRWDGVPSLAEALRMTWPFGGLPLGGVFLGQANGPLVELARLGGPLLVTAGVWTGGVAIATLVTRLAARRAGRATRLRPQP